MPNSPHRSTLSPSARTGTVIVRLMASQAVLAHNIPHEILTAEQVNERFPGYRLPANFKVCFACRYVNHARWHFGMRHAGWCLRTR